MNPLEEFFARLCARLADTPYVATRTPGGIAVTLNLSDARWHPTLFQRGVDDVVVHHLRLDPAKRLLRIVDETRPIEWQAGAGAAGVPVPLYVPHGEPVLGRAARASDRRVPGFRPHAEAAIGTIDNADAARLIVSVVAAELGWQPRTRRDDAANHALVGLGLLVALVIALGLLALLFG